MTNKSLWGDEFYLVKNSLVEEDVESLLQSLQPNAETRLEPVQYAARLKELAERMESILGGVLEATHKLQEDSIRLVEQEKDTTLEEARKTADKVISKAEEASKSIKQQLEEAAKEKAEEADKIIYAAKERAQEIEREAKVAALAIEREARENAAEISEAIERMKAKEAVRIGSMNPAPAKRDGYSTGASVDSKSEMPVQSEPIQAPQVTSSPVEEKALFEGNVQLVLPGNTDASSLLSVQEALENTEGISITGLATSEGETRISLLVKSPQPLTEILGSLPHVSGVAEISPSRRILGRLPKMHPDTSSPMRRLRVAIPTGSRR